MSLGANTQVVDGQRNIFPTRAQYAPMSYGAQTTGVPQVSPTLPPFLGGGGSAAGSPSLSGTDDVDGYGTAGNNALMTQVANAHPHNLKVSPVWWAIGSLVVGLLLLRGVHWRQTILEGGENARVGRASERAEAEA